MKSIKYYNIDTLTDLSTVKFSGDSTDSTYFTYSNTTPQSGTPDIPWHSVCSVSSVNQIYSHGKFYFPGKSGYSGTVYGVQWDTSDPSPECTRIGNMSLHATLPVQSQMAGGLMLDDGTFNEFGNQSDWTSYTRDGSLGQVMVKIPTFWIKFETLGNIYRVLMSSEPVIGFKMVKEMYCSAYEAALDRTNLKLSSVVNKTAQYRGGNNNASWDSEDTAGNGGESHRSLLGRPATSISLTNFRTYARNRGSSAWNCYFYLMHKILYWLYVVEYATLNSQKAFNSSLDSNGFHQGGLGDGVSTLNGTSWNNFNGYCPFIPCGWTDDYGNSTSIKNYTAYNASGTTLKTFAVPRYRGIENPFGHIWKVTDGLLIQVYSGSDGISQIYETDNPTDFSSTSYSAYNFIGNGMRTSNYVMQLHLGDDGDITAESGNGSSASYYCDYNVTDVSWTGLRAVFLGGATDHLASSGFICSYSSSPVTHMHIVIGSRLTYFDAWRDVVYEEYEWLISNSDSNGTPYINTLIIPNVGQEISFTFKVLDATTNGNEAGVYNATDSSWSLRVIRCYKNTANNYMILEYNNNNNDYPNHTTMVVYDEFATNKEYECSLTINSATSALGVINNNSKTLVPNSDVTLGSDSHKIFVNGTTNPKWSFKSVGFKKFKISGIIDLIPCKLLTSIPASMDGNNTPRQAGECGMWDKVSNKFYGNVANSGTFTVEGGGKNL